jgi:hypothetical protein
MAYHGLNKLMNDSAKIKKISESMMLTDGVYLLEHKK